VCKQCEADYYCPGGLAQLRLSCPAAAVSIARSTHAGMCLCTPGFAPADARLPYDCVACAGGTIKVAVGNVACTPCVAGEYSVSELACGACPALTQSPAGSASLAACVSVPGAYAELGAGQAARLCLPGTYQDEANQTSCKACPDNTYQPGYGATQADAYVGFPQRSAIRPAGPGTSLSNCTCDAGSSGPDGGPCAPCAAGTFKSAAGRAECQQCPPDAYVCAGSSACVTCPANSTSLAGSTALANCTCVAGFGATAEPFACDACAPGSAKPAGNTDCTTCPAGSFAN
jgi:hypothetical protein